MNENMMTQIKRGFSPKQFSIISSADRVGLIERELCRRRRRRRLLSSINNPFFVRTTTILDYGFEKKVETKEE